MKMCSHLFVLCAPFEGYILPKKGIWLPFPQPMPHNVPKWRTNTIIVALYQQILISIWHACLYFASWNALLLIFTTIINLQLTLEWSIKPVPRMSASSLRVYVVLALNLLPMLCQSMMQLCLLFFQFCFSYWLLTFSQFLW